MQTYLFFAIREEIETRTFFLHPDFVILHLFFFKWTDKYLFCLKFRLHLSHWKISDVWGDKCKFPSWPKSFIATMGRFLDLDCSHLRKWRLKLEAFAKLDLGASQTGHFSKTVGEEARFKSEFIHDCKWRVNSRVLEKSVGFLLQKGHCCGKDLGVVDDGKQFGVTTGDKI